MRVAVTSYLYFDVKTQEEAVQLKNKMEGLLKSPMVDGIIKSQIGPQYIGVVVLDPVPAT